MTDWRDGLERRKSQTDSVADWRSRVAPRAPDEFQVPTAGTGDTPVADPPSLYNAAPTVIDDNVSETAAIGAMMRVAGEVGGNDELGILKVAKQMNVSTDMVRRNYEGFRKAAQQSGFDPLRWRKENPILARLVLDRPDTGKVVQVDQELSVLAKAIGFLGRWHAPRYVKPEDLNDQDLQRIEQSGGRLPEIPDPVTPDVKTVTMLENDKSASLAKLPAFQRALIAPYQRAKETAAQMDIADLSFRRMQAELGVTNEDPVALSQQIHDLKLASIPLNLGDSPIIADLVSGPVSTAYVAKSTLEDASMGAVVGGAIAGAGAAVARQPQAVLPAIAAGAKFGAGVGAGTGTFRGSFALEAGSTFDTLLDTKTDDGRMLTTQEAAGGAIIAGILKAGIEVAQFSALKGAATSFLPLLEGGSVASLLVKNSAFRATAIKVSKEFFSETVKNGIEEGVQEAIDQGANYLTPSVAQGSLSTREAFNTGDLIETTWKGMLGGAVMGGVGPLITVGVKISERDTSTEANKQIGPILDLAKNETAQTLAGPLSKAIAEHSAAGGESITAVHVDPLAIKRYYQSQGTNEQDADAHLSEVVGSDAPAKLKEALATGTKLEIPLETVLTSYGASKMADALKADTAMAPHLLTDNEVKNQSAQIEQEAIRIATPEIEEAAAEARVNDLLQSRLEEQIAALVSTGKISRKEARKQAQAQMALDKAFYARLADGVSPEVRGKRTEELFQKYLIKYAAGDNAAEVTDSNVLNQSPLERAATLTTEQKATEINIDPLTNLRRFDVWKSLPRTKPLVAVVTSRDVKAINDNENAGHDVTNQLLKAIGEQIPIDGARKGTSFVFEASTPEELQAVLDAINERLPAGLEAIGSTGVDTETATQSLRTIEAELEKTVPRGQTRFDTTQLRPDSEFGAGDARAPALTQEMIDAAERSSPDEHARAAYFDPKMDGVLSDLGFEAAGPKAHVMALDLRGLKDTNIKLGEETGDHALDVFARAAMAAGGKDIFFTHKSGDEFAAKSDSLEALRAFEKAIQLALEINEFETANEAGVVGVYRVQFRNGIGDRTYGAADRALNAQKNRESGSVSTPISGRTGVGQGAGAEAIGRGSDAATVGNRGETSGSSGAGSSGANEGTSQGRLNATGEDGTPRGYASFEKFRGDVQKVVEVFLNKTADFSTLVHESAHAYVRITADAVNDPLTSQAVKDNFAALLKWAGADSFENLTREGQEKIARGFEAFMLEGKAPSSALKRAFSKAQSWLMSIYRGVNSVAPELNDEIRQVFSRMLASEEQTRNMAARRGLTEPTLEAGNTQDEVDEWQLEITEASRKLQLATLKDQKHTMEQWWKVEYARIAEGMAEQWENLPGRVAQTLLDGTGYGRKQDPVTLDRDELEKIIRSPEFKKLAPGFQANLTAAWKTKIAGITTSKTAGASIKEFASVAGFKSGAEMVAAIVNLKPRDAWVKQRTDGEMSRLHPGVLQRKEEMAKLVADGLTALTEKTIIQEGKFTEVEVQATRRAAKLIVDARQLDTLQPGAALAAERRAATAMIRAARSGEWANFRVAAEQRLLNSMLFSKLREAVELRERLEATGKDASKDKARSKLGLASPEYRDGVDYIIQSLGFMEPIPGLTDSALIRATEQIRNDLSGSGEWLEEVVLALKKADWNKLSVAEARIVQGAISNIQIAARDRNSTVIDAKRVSLEDVVDESISAMTENMVARPPPPTRGTETFNERLVNVTDRATGFLVSLPDLLRDATGDNQESIFWKATVGKIRAAKHVEADLMKSVMEPLVKAFAAMPKDVRNRFTESVDGEKLLPNHTKEQGNIRTRGELLMMALNMGNIGNEQRLTDGRNISSGEVVAALNDLSKEEIEWVQTVFDVIESIGPKAFDLEERMTGLRPEKVEARSLTLKNGTLRGGYFPAVYERTSAIGERQASSALSQLVDGTYVRSTTPHGHLKARADKVVAVISLSPQNIVKHLQQTVHDVAFRETVKEVGQLFFHPKMDAALKRFFGQSKTDAIRNTLMDIARGAGAPSAVSIFNDIAQWQRSNMAPAVLGFSVANAAGDFANLAAAVAGTPLKYKALGDGMVEFASNPIKAIAWARENSAEFRGMDHSLQKQFTKDFAFITDKQLFENGPLARLKEHAFILQEAVQTGTATPILIGAYRQALNEGKTEAQAMVFAEDILTRVFPQRHVSENSALMRDKGFAGMTVVFGGYLNLAFRNVYNLGRKFRSAQYAAASPAQKARIAATTMLATAGFVAAYGPLGDLLMGRGPEDGDRDEYDPESTTLKWLNWFKRRMIVDTLQLIPFVPGEMLNALMLGRRPDNPRSDVVTSFGVQLGESALAVYKSVANYEDGTGLTKEDKKALDAIVRAVALMTGQPLTAPARAAGYLASQPETDNPIQAAGGLIYGKKRGNPENLLSILGGLAE